MWSELWVRRRRLDESCLLAMGRLYVPEDSLETVPCVCLWLDPPDTLLSSLCFSEEPALPSSGKEVSMPFSG